MYSKSDSLSSLVDSSEEFVFLNFVCLAQLESSLFIRLVDFKDNLNTFNNTTLYLLFFFDSFPTHILRHFVYPLL